MRSLAETFIIAVALILCGCAPALHLDDALTLVRYRLEPSGRIIIDVQVNDRGIHPFAVDTAASISFIFEELRQELALAVLPTTTATVHGAVASGRFPVVTVDRLRVGEEVWHGAELVVLPGDTEATATIAGILGIDFLRRYGVGFSARDRVLRLYPPKLVGDRSYRGWASVPLMPVAIGESREALYFLDVELAGNAVPALFDLGAGMNMMNTAAARHLRLTPRRVEEGSLLAGALERAPVLAQLSQEVATGDIRWRNEVFLISDVEIFATLLHADRPLAIVGAGMFNQRDFVIDFVRNRLLVRTTDEVDAAPAP